MSQDYSLNSHLEEPILLLTRYWTKSLLMMFLWKVTAKAERGRNLN